MTTIKHKLDTATVAFSMHDINVTLKKVSTYAWLAAGVLFVSYLYFVGAITFSVIKQEGLAQNIKTTVSEIGKHELEYLKLQKSLTESFAIAQGFVSADTIAYTAPASAFAWNFDGRTE